MTDRHCNSKTFQLNCAVKLKDMAGGAGKKKMATETLSMQSEHRQKGKSENFLRKQIDYFSKQTHSNDIYIHTTVFLSHFSYDSLFMRSAAVRSIK